MFCLFYYYLLHVIYILLYYYAFQYFGIFCYSPYVYLRRCMILNTDFNSRVLFISLPKVKSCLVFTGDLIVGHDGLTKEAKHSLESNAIQKLKSLLSYSTEAAESFESLWNEYESQSSPEAQMVKDLDRYDMILQGGLLVVLLLK